MVLQYPALRTDIDLDNHTVVIDNTPHKVRPRTFQLLRVLIEADGELVSKDTLLSTVWDDVTVDEQVIFQSIKELRKLFPGQSAIKTVPRKGYAWLPKASAQPSVDKPRRSAVSKPKGIALVIAGVVLFLVLMLRPWFSPASPPVSGSVVVLPVASDLPGNAYDWVRYGVMDQVISRLISTEHAGVLQTDYVLNVMARAKVSNEAVFDGQIAPIFAVSGAELILAMRVTGSPKDYQIIYTLYQRDGLEKGSVFGASVQDAADQVASLVGHRITPDFVLSQTAYQSAFADRLIAEALEHKSAGQGQAALEMLKAAHSAAPDNLVAARLMVQTLVESGAPHDAVKQTAEPAIALAEQTNSMIDQIRLNFWLAVSETLKVDERAGLTRLQAVEDLATGVNDWLYLAYVEEIRGQIRHKNERYAMANTHFQHAMNYHRILHCPLGESNTLMHLSRLAAAQNNRTLAIDRARQALGLIESRNLTNKLPQAQQWLTHLSAESPSE